MRKRLQAIGSSLGATVMTSALLVFGAGTASADTPPDTTPPSVPTDVTYRPNENGYAGSLHWDASHDNVTPVSDVRYRLYVDGERVVPKSKANQHDKTPSFWFFAEVYNDLNPLPNGDYTVTAVDEAGNESAPSAPVSIGNLVDHTPPSVPTDFTHPANALEWGPSVDNLSTVRYQVYIDGDPIQLLSVPIHYGDPERVKVDLVTEIFVCINEDLRPGVYTVTAVDVAGNESAPSNPVRIDHLLDLD